MCGSRAGEREKLRHRRRTWLPDGEWVSWDFLFLESKQAQARKEKAAGAGSDAGSVPVPGDKSLWEGRARKSPVAGPVAGPEVRVAVPLPGLCCAWTGPELEVDVSARICESKQEGEWGAAAVFTRRLFIVVPQRLVLGTFNTFLLGAGSFWPGLDARQELEATPEVSQVPGAGCHTGALCPVLSPPLAVS